VTKAAAEVGLENIPGGEAVVVALINQHRARRRDTEDQSEGVQG